MVVENRFDWYEGVLDQGGDLAAKLPTQENGVCLNNAPDERRIG